MKQPIEAIHHLFQLIKPPTVAMIFFNTINKNLTETIFFFAMNLSLLESFSSFSVSSGQKPFNGYSAIVVKCMLTESVEVNHMLSYKSRADTSFQ